MLQQLDRFTLQRLKGPVMHFTAAAARLIRDGHSLQFSSVSHPPAIIVRPGEASRLLDSANTILGRFEDAVRQESAVEVSLEEVERVVTLSA
jgi:serine phosphatase RsbU (regulator of sigma subunit)